MSKITTEQAAYLLCSAIEGGSNYWACIESFETPEVTAEPWGVGEYHPKYISYPFSAGGAVIFSDDEDEDAGETFRLDVVAIAQGTHIMETDARYSHHYADIIQENDDAETGDVFLQLCLFGEVIYG